MPAKVQFCTAIHFSATDDNEVAILWEGVKVYVLAGGALGA